MQHRLDEALIGQLAVDADDRLGAGEAHEQPAHVAQLVFEAVGGVDAGDGDASDALRLRRPNARQRLRALLAGKARVNAVVVVALPQRFEERLQQLRGRLAGAHHEIEEVEVAQNAIALRDVAPEGVAAALLAADEAIHLQELGRDVLEAHAGLVDGDAVQLPQAVEHLRGRERLDDRAAFAAHFEEVVGQQPEDAQLIHELAVLIADAHAVGVAIGDEAHVRAKCERLRQRRIHVGLDRLRALHLRKERVARRVDFADSRAPAAEQSREPARRVAPHRLDEHVQPGVAQPLQVYQPAKMGDVRGIGIEARDQPARLRRVQIEPRHVAQGGGDSGFDFLQARWGNRAAGGIAHLEAVIRGRIVARGDVDRAARPALHHRVADDGGGGVARCEPDVDAVARQHLGGGSGEVFRLKALVIANDAALLSQRVLLEIGGKALRGPAHIVEGVVLRNPRPPAVRAEFDGSRHVVVVLLVGVVSSEQRIVEQRAVSSAKQILFTAHCLLLTANCSLFDSRN